MVLKVEPIPPDTNAKEFERFKKFVGKDWKLLPPPNSRVLIIGRVNSGKTSILYSMLTKWYAKTGKDGKYKNSWFDLIVAFLGTCDMNVWFEKLGNKKTDVEIYNDWNNAEFDNFMKELVETQEARRQKKERLLRVAIVFDDFQGNAGFSKRTTMNAVDKLMITNRHLNASVFLVGHSYKFFNLNLRVNHISHLILPDCCDADLDRVAEEHGNGMDKDQFKKLFMYCKKCNKYNYLVVDYKEPIERRFKNTFNKVIKIKDLGEDKDENKDTLEIEDEDTETNKQK